MFTIQRRIALAFIASLLISAQEPVAQLQVSGDVKQQLNLSAQDLAKLPRASVKVTRNALETTYDGVWLSEILKAAGVPQGDSLRGKALAGYLIAEADDGYQVVLSLGEVDPSFADQPVLLADTANGKPLFGGEGHFRLVLPKDKVGARSIRMLHKITVVQLRK